MAPKAAEESTEDLYDNAPCGYFSTAEDGTFIRVNRTFSAWSGYRQEDLVDRRRMQDLLDPGSRIYYETHYAPLLRMQGAVREIAVDIVRADGTRLPVIANSVLRPGAGDTATLIRTAIFAAGDRRRYEGELLTARREAERLLDERDAEQLRLRRMLDTISEGVVMLDRDLRVRFVNHGARKIRHLEQLETGEVLQDAWEGFSLRSFAGGLFSKETHPYRAEHAPTPNATYAIVGIPAHMTNEAMLVFTDLSEVARREQAEREFVANASHELRTPLTAILCAIDALQAGAKEIPHLRDQFLANLEHDAARLGILTQALLLLAEVQALNEPPPIGSINLRALLEETAKALQVRDGVAIEIDCEPDAQVATNGDLAAQALASVAANAAKYTVAGRISLAASISGDCATILVSDTGPGIPTDSEARLFDRFYRTGDRVSNGFGLGLSIAHQAMQSLGGTLDLRPALNAGTIAELRLPVRP